MVSITDRRLARLLDEVQSAVSFDQPLLTVRIDQERVVAEGTFIVLPTTPEFSGQGPIAEYQVKVDIALGYPRIEPKALETGGAIPRNADHHINPDGTCCVVIWEAWIAAEADISIKAYFDGPLKNYFLGQHLKRETGKWPFGEWAHGDPGLVDAFAERLGCKPNQKTVRYLLRILSKDWPRGHWACPCRSGKIIRKCCRSEMQALSQKVPPSNARRMLARLPKQAP